jgi:serine/threonine-protein kinase
VVTQRPSAGTGHRGDQVRLVVSLGPRLVAVPDVDSYGVEAAKAALVEAGFRVEVDTYEIASFGLGFVVEQQPAAGAMAPLGSTVTVYLV